MPIQPEAGCQQGRTPRPARCGTPIDANRLRRRLRQLLGCGARPGAVERTALTAAVAEAWRIVLHWAEPAGLHASADAIGNLFLSLPGEDASRPPILVGSHLDEAPGTGGQDGALGMLVALEAVLAVAAGAAASGRAPVRDLILVVWMNGQGGRFAPAGMGAATFTGYLSLFSARAVRDAAGVPVGEAAACLLSGFPAVARRPLGFIPAFYLEPAGKSGATDASPGRIGVPGGLDGRRGWDLEQAGPECPARAEALYRALCGEIGAADAAARLSGGPAGCGAGHARFHLELRHADGVALERLGIRVEAMARRSGLTLIRSADVPPVTFDPALRDLVATAVADRDHGTQASVPAAADDARHMASMCPSAMICAPLDLAAGAVTLAEVLAEVLWRLAYPAGA